MPLAPAAIDPRDYQQLVDEALARIPVHNPEWTNFNKSDPGVTLLELFAFLAESVIYRANLIPDRNRLKFLSLLGVPLSPASAARGLVAFSNDRGPLAPIPLPAGTEVRAGKIPFRVEGGLDVLPVEGAVYFKRERPDPAGELLAQYRRLYASYHRELPNTDIQLYDTVPLAAAGQSGVDLGQGAIGHALWIALLFRTADRQSGPDPKGRTREALAGRTLNLGFVPVPDEDEAGLVPAAPPDPTAKPRFVVELVTANTGGGTTYRALELRATTDLWTEPGVAEVTLPAAGDLDAVDELDPLEAGVGDRPPAVADAAIAERLVAWLRVRPVSPDGAPLPSRLRLLYAGINAATVTQRERVVNEVLPSGTGEPDQSAVLARGPVLPGSVTVRVRPPGGAVEEWDEVNDLLTAGPEVPVPDPRKPPGTPLPPPRPTRVFAFDPEAGRVTFGDGTRGTRPPFGASIWADYDVAAGPAGNVGKDSVNSGPELPPGMKVTNPIPTWGGAAAESVTDGEKQVAQFLRHRDRLVTAEDFEAITKRTPGIAVGRVNVLAAYNPALGASRAGDAAGAVTLLVIPAHDPNHPDAPVPDRAFLRAICDYLEPRRLVTTELILRGPEYKPIWVTVGIEVDAGFGISQVQEDVRRAVRRFLSPLPQDEEDDGGWPLNKPVLSLELLAVANRVAGVRLVTGVGLVGDSDGATDRIDIAGLELPKLIGLSVAPGPPPDPALLRDGNDPGTTGPAQLPVPAVPDEC